MLHLDWTDEISIMDQTIKIYLRRLSFITQLILLLPNNIKLYIIKPVRYIIWEKLNFDLALSISETNLKSKIIR